jgi:hypothetical protein
MSDWRLMGQDRYLQGRHLVLQQWRPCRAEWDHDHCAFCQRHISLPLATDDDEDAVDRGYATDDGYDWICESCFADFKGAVQLDSNRALIAAEADIDVRSPGGADLSFCHDDHAGATQGCGERSRCAAAGVAVR